MEKTSPAKNFGHSNRMTVHSMEKPREPQTQYRTSKKGTKYQLLLPVFWKWIGVGDWSQKHVQHDAYKGHKPNQMGPDISSFRVNFKNALKARPK